MLQQQVKSNQGIVQINDAVNNLDKITQINAQNASQANEIAQETLEISNDIISQADAKEFNGKNSFYKELKSKRFFFYSSFMSSSIKS